MQSKRIAHEHEPDERIDFEIELATRGLRALWEPGKDYKEPEKKQEQKRYEGDRYSTEYRNE